VFLVAEIEAESIECASEVGRPIDQERRLLDLLVLLEFTKKQQRELRRTRLKQPHVKNFVRCWVDSSVQPVALVVALNHCLVHRDVIRFSVAAGLYVGFLYPAVNRRSTAFDTQPIEYLFGIRKREADNVELNTYFNDLAGCPLSLNKF
jgi:hypothetical protein